MSCYHYVQSRYYDSVTGHAIDVQHGDLYRRTDDEIEEIDIEELKGDNNE